LLLHPIPPRFKRREKHRRLAILKPYGVAAGIPIGGVAGDLFVTLLKLTRAAARQVPPFRVIANRGDYLKLYDIVGGMLAVGVAVLSVRIWRMRMAQAAKLGKE